MASTSQEIAPLPAPAAAIELGSGNYFVTLWRLTRMELYKIRRRRYTIITGSILLGLLVLGFLIFGFYAFLQAQQPPSSFAHSICAPGGTAGSFTCTTPNFSQAQLEQMKQTTMQGMAAQLGLPGSLGLIFTILEGTAFLAIVLLGPLSGTEYTLGTVRLLFTRGPTRLQCVIAKLVASLITLAAFFVLAIVVWVGLGMLLYPLSGIPYSYTFGFFHAANFGSMFSATLLTGLIVLVYWFALSTLAFFFGTLARSTAAAIGSAFGWYVFEGIASSVLALLSQVITSGTLHDLFQQIPTYLISTNFSALIQNRTNSAGGSAFATITDLHALLVIGGYFVVLIGSSLLLTWRRDVTN